MSLKLFLSFPPTTRLISLKLAQFTASTCVAGYFVGRRNLSQFGGNHVLVRYTGLTSSQYSWSHTIAGRYSQVPAYTALLSILKKNTCASLTNSFSNSSAIFSKAAVQTAPAQAGSQKDVSLLTAKRGVRRTKLKDTAVRDQVYYGVTAFSTAESYNLESIVADVKRREQYQVVSLPEDAFDAVHLEAVSENGEERKQLFIFREGSVVFWNVPEDEQKRWLSLMCSHQEAPYDPSLVQEEQETIEFTYTDGKTQLTQGDMILHRPTSYPERAASQLDMFAFSNALSLSVKLAVWEALLAQYVDSIEWVLQDLKHGKKIRMSEADALRKAGELYTLSHLINLSSDLLDTPDFYWDRDELELLYNKTCNYLNIARRTKVMNEKLGQCVELVELLRDHLKDKHHTRLEMMIIILIMIEVGFAIFHLFERHYFKSDGLQHSDT